MNMKEMFEGFDMTAIEENKKKNLPPAGMNIR